MIKDLIEIQPLRLEIFLRAKCDRKVRFLNREFLSLLPNSKDRMSQSKFLRVLS